MFAFVIKQMFTMFGYTAAVILFKKEHLLHVGFFIREDHCKIFNSVAERAL